MIQFILFRAIYYLDYLVWYSLLRVWTFNTSNPEGCRVIEVLYLWRGSNLWG